MVTSSIQDRTAEFRAVLAQAQKKQSSSRLGAQRRSLLSDAQRRAANGSPSGNAQAGKKGARSEFARNAAQIGRGITGTMEKLERLAQLAKRKTLFDDRPLEIAELTHVIKQDIAALNSQISALQSLQKGQLSRSSRGGPEQEGEHNKNVVLFLQGKLTDVGANFKEVLEVRTKNIQASRSRTENFVSSVSAHAQPTLDSQHSASPLYHTPTKSRTPQPGYQNSNPDILNLDPSSSSSALAGPQSDQQMLLMEEAQAPNTYIGMRGEAIDTIERTINELGSVFGQLAAMVSEQGEQIQRIDANTEDVVENVEGALDGRASEPKATLKETTGIDRDIDTIEQIPQQLQCLQQHAVDDPGASPNTQTGQEIDAVKPDPMAFYQVTWNDLARDPWSKGQAGVMHNNAVTSVVCFCRGS